MSLISPPQPTILSSAVVGAPVVQTNVTQKTAVVAKSKIKPRQSNDTPVTVVHLHS